MCQIFGHPVILFLEVFAQSVTESVIGLYNGYQYDFSLGSLHFCQF